MIHSCILFFGALAISEKAKVRLRRSAGNAKVQGTLYFKKASIKESSYKETVQPRRSANLENKQTSLRSWNLFIKINEYYTPFSGNFRKCIL
jgi:hypothetical protein